MAEGTGVIVRLILPYVYMQLFTSRDMSCIKLLCSFLIHINPQFRSIEVAKLLWFLRILLNPVQPKLKHLGSANSDPG